MILKKKPQIQQEVQNQAGQNSENVENKTPKFELKSEEIAVIVPNQTMNFKEQLSMLQAQQNVIYDFSLTSDFASTYEFDCATITEEDAKFFLDVIEYNKNEQFVQSVGDIKVLNNVSVVEQNITPQNVKATEKIMEILDTASKTNKPVRIDFDNQITLVLKVNTDGKLFAQFYPGDRAAEEYLKNNIQSLRNTFDEKNILYSYLDYGQRKRENNKERREK